MRRLAFFLLFFAAISVFAQDSAQNPARAAEPQASASQASASKVPLAPAPQGVSKEVLDAEAAIAKSDLKTAQTKLNAWLAVHPTDARALFDAGYVADAENHLDDAARLYRRAINANQKSFDAHLSLGLLLARQGKINDARKELSLATTLNPGRGGPALKARAWRALARIDSYKSPQKASQDLLEALKLSPETLDDTLMAANLAAQSGQYDAAEAAYRRVLAKDPKSAAASSGLAHLLIVQNKYAQAKTVLSSALKYSPDDVPLNTQLAAVLANENDDAALPLLEKLHTAHPSITAITRMLADVMAEEGDYAGSDRLYTSLLAASPNDVDLLIAHGRNLIRLTKYAEAYAAFKHASKLDPTNSDGWSGLAFAASQTNRPSETLYALTMRSEYLPENASTYFLWATSYDKLHQYKAAIVYYRHFLNAASGKYAREKAQARRRLQILEK